MSHVLGPIIRLQVQRSTLKIGEKPNRRYDPGPLQAVERMEIGPDGAVGLVDASRVVDVHNRAHPESKNSDGENTLSVGFTDHYRAMQDRYGPHMVLGCAGENIIVDIERVVTAGEVVHGFRIVSPAGDERLRLVQPRVAHPCKPFSGFAHRHQLVAPEVLKGTLQFLDDGMRGYYCAPDTSGPVVIQVGDLVSLL